MEFGFEYVPNSVTTFCNEIGLTALPPHIPLIIISFLSFFILESICDLLSPLLFPNTYTKLNKKTKLDWSLHFTGWIHSLISVPLVLSVLLYPSDSLIKDPLFGYAPREARVFAISAGYFYYDLVVSLWNIKTNGWPFVIHAASCCFIFLGVWCPRLMGVGGKFLIWEASTIFLHPHWYFDKLDMTGSTAQLINGIFLLISFFSARIVYGGIQTVVLWKLLDEDRIGNTWKWGFRAANIALNLLNWTWFRMMIISVRSRLGGNKEKKGKKAE